MSPRQSRRSQFHDQRADHVPGGSDAEADDEHVAAARPDAAAGEDAARGADARSARAC